MDEDHVEEEEGGGKRRRTVAPSLEGKSRGWNPAPVVQEEVGGEYRDANTLLHELHALNRHRSGQSPEQYSVDTGGEGTSVKERYEERNK